MFFLYAYLTLAIVHRTGAHPALFHRTHSFCIVTVYECNSFDLLLFALILLKLPLLSSRFSVIQSFFSSNVQGCEKVIHERSASECCRPCVSVIADRFIQFPGSL